MYISHRLHELWDNGNKKAVFEELFALPASQAALVAVEIHSYIAHWDRRLEFERSLRAFVEEKSGKSG